jgi:two-component system sensor histidine kinase PilS (NtrC family)
VTPPELEVEVDPRQLRQVLGNLCDNALKYGRGDDGGPARICLRGEPGSDGQDPTLEVADRGPGIPKEHWRQLFEPFFTTSRRGTGLGLYIARELCEINGIDLSYRPGPEGGSRFRLRFRRWRRDPNAP